MPLFEMLAPAESPPLLPWFEPPAPPLSSAQIAAPPCPWRVDRSRVIWPELSMVIPAGTPLPDTPTLEPPGLPDPAFCCTKMASTVRPIVDAFSDKKIDPELVRPIPWLFPPL